MSFECAQKFLLWPLLRSHTRNQNFASICQIAHNLELDFDRKDHIMRNLLRQSAPTFDYGAAFSRNLGWVTLEEQETLRNTRVAIAGLGGTGGNHCLALARLGIGAFSIADFDSFELANFNRQAGATQSNLGKPKASVLREQILDINPEARLSVFREALDEENINQFLENVDLVVDALDFFAIDARRTLYKNAKRLGIPVMIVAPIGHGTSIMVFDRNSLGFDEYFGFRENNREEWAIRFALGLAPSFLHLKALAERKRFNFEERTTPSLSAGVYMAAGVAVSFAIKVILGRGEVSPSPQNFHFDPYEFKTKVLRNWGGSTNPLFKLKFLILRTIYERAQKAKKKGTVLEAYSSPAWWYDLRGFLILTFAYRSTLWQQVGFFAKEMGPKHLEAAVGTGTLFDFILIFRRLLGMEPVDIEAFDYAPRMLEGAIHTLQKKKYGKAVSGLNLRIADAAQLPYSDASFDSLHIANSFHCLPQPLESLREFHRVLKPNGSFRLNVILVPKGSGVFQELARRIIAWGIQKGLLLRPYELAEVQELMENSQFSIESTLVHGNTLSLIAKKRG